jgi:hypothetical protein
MNKDGEWGCIRKDGIPLWKIAAGVAIGAAVLGGGGKKKKKKVKGKGGEPKQTNETTKKPRVPTGTTTESKMKN